MDEEDQKQGQSGEGNPTPETQPQTQTQESKPNNPFGSGKTVLPNQEKGSEDGGEGGNKTTPNDPGVEGDGGNKPALTPEERKEMTPQEVAQYAAQSVLETQRQRDEAERQKQLQEQAGKPKQYTAEELNLFKVDQKIFKRIFESESEEEAIAALNDFGQGLVKQAFTMARLSQQQSLEGLRTEINPYMSFAQQQKELMMQEQFFTKFPQLRGMDPVVKQVIDQMAQEGYKGKNEEETLKEVAKRAQAQLDQYSKLGQAASGQNQQTQTQTQTQNTGGNKPSMASVPAAGSGGSGGNPGNGEKTNAAKRVFG